MSLSQSVDIKIVGDDEFVFVDPCIHPVHAASFHFSDTDVLWLTNSDSLDELPAAATTLNAKIKIPKIGSSSFSVESHTTTIGGCSLEIVDKNGEFSKHIRDKRLSSIGTRKISVKLYECCDGEVITDDHIVRTYEWYSHTYNKGIVTLSLKEIIYTTKETIFDVSTARLAKSYVVDTDTKIRIFDDSGEDLSEMFPVFQHTKDYKNQSYSGEEGQGLNPTSTYDPSIAKQSTHEAFGYLKTTSNGNIICHSGFKALSASENVGGATVWEADVIKFGALNSTSTSLEISEDVSSIESYPEVKEVVYLEESIPELIFMVWTSQSLNGNRAFPWGLNISPESIDSTALISLANEELTTPRVITSEPVKAKEFLQKEIFPIIGGMADTTKNGLLTLKRFQSPMSDTVGSHTLDHGNCIVSSPLSTNKDTIYNSVELEWGYDESDKKYRQRNKNVYLDSASLYGNTETKTIKLKWLQLGQQTQAAVKTIIDTLAMQYAYERLTLSVTSLPSMGYLKKGDVVHCDFEGVRDASSDDNAEINLNRAMLITGVSPVKGTRQVTYSLVGYTKRPATGDTSQTVQHITSDDIKTEGRKPLSTVCNITNNEVLNPTGPIPPGDYYHDDHLTWVNTTPYTLSAYGNLSIWIPSDKHFEDNSSTGFFSGVAMGLHAGGQGATSVGGNAKPGETGYFGSSTGGGGVSFSNEEEAFVIRNETVKGVNNGAVTGAKVDSMQPLALRMEEGKIIGLPSDLSGSGGGGGGKSVQVTKKHSNNTTTATYYDGTDGGRGGAGLEILCGSFSFSAGNKLDLSGGDVAQPQVIRGISYAGSGVGGAPGAFHLIMPKGATHPYLNDYLVSKFGVDGGLGNRMTSIKMTAIQTFDLGIPISSYYPPSKSSEQNTSTHLVSTIPADVAPSEPLSVFTGEEWRSAVDSLDSDMKSLFSQTMKNNIVTHYQTAQPTGANDLDYWADTGNIDPDGRPDLYQYIDGVWSAVPLTDAHGQLIRTSYAGMTQAQQANLTADKKSTTFITDSENKNDWPTPTGYGDLLFVEPLSQVYRCEDGTTWNSDDSFVDELSELAAANIIIDGGFHKAAYQNRKTWKRSISECEFHSGTNGYGSNPKIQYGAYGEGGAAGARITISNNTNTSWSNEPSLDSAYLVVPAEKYHQAKKGDVFRISVRGKADGGYFGFGVTAYDKDYNYIGNLGRANFISNGNWETKDLMIDVNSTTVNMDSVQFVRGGIYGVHNGGSYNESNIDIDFVSMERSQTWDTIDTQVGDLLTLSTSDSGKLYGTFIDVFSSNDVVEITFTAQFIGDTASDAIAYNIGLGRPKGTSGAGDKIYYVNPEASKKIGDGVWTSVFNKITLTGITPAEDYYAGYWAWGSPGTSIKNASYHVSITRK